MAYIYLLLLIFCGVSNCWKCERSIKPPNSSLVLEEYTIDLDLPPEIRWKQLLSRKASILQNLFGDIEILIESLVGERIYKVLENELSKVAETLPHPYREELKGMSYYSNLPLSHLTMYNIFYELFVLCTSVVVEDAEGNIFHARNLDNGALLGWDVKNHTWKVTEKLKPLTVVLHWKKDGRILYRSVSFAGYIGVLTAVKENKYSFSLNKRMSLNNGIIGMLEWMLGDHTQSWVTFLPRQVLETTETYEEAKAVLSSSRLIAPVYYILAGTRTGEAAIITRFRDNVDVMELGSKSSGQGSWFLVETNYDHWKDPPFYDDRKTPAIKCLKKGGRVNVTVESLYNVLSSIPILNKGTVYTTVMQAKNGNFRSWIRDCPSPCFPW